MGEESVCSHDPDQASIPYERKPQIGQYHSIFRVTLGWPADRTEMPQSGIGAVISDNESPYRVQAEGLQSHRAVQLVGL